MMAVQIYALINDAKEKKVNGFYNQVQSEIELVRKEDVLLVVGDYTGKVRNSTEKNLVELYDLRTEVKENNITFCRSKDANIQ